VSNVIWLAVVVAAAIWIVRLRIQLNRERAYCRQMIRESASGVRLAMRLRNTCERAEGKRYIATLGLEREVRDFWTEFDRA
jgi:hypothetical protein